MQVKPNSKSKFQFEMTFQRVDHPTVNDITCYYGNFKTVKSKNKFCLDYLICFCERLKLLKEGKHLFHYEFKSWLDDEYSDLISNGFFVDGKIDYFREGFPVTYYLEYTIKTRHCYIECPKPTLPTLYLCLIRLTWELIEDNFLSKEEIKFNYLKAVSYDNDPYSIEE